MCNCTPEDRSSHEPSAATKRLLEVNLPAARNLSEEHGQHYWLTNLLEKVEAAYDADHRLEATLAAQK